MDWLNIKTVPGFVMHSQHFELEFVAGFQGGFPNSYLEYQTNWYEVMDLLLSKFEEEPEVLEAFELVASKELEHWARGRSDGDPLHLRIQVTLEEKGYFLPHRCMRKEVKVSFNDKFSTVVLLYVRKKVQLETLKGLAAAKVADYLHFESACYVMCMCNVQFVCVMCDAQRVHALFINIHILANIGKSVYVDRIKIQINNKSFKMRI